MGEENFPGEAVTKKSSIKKKNPQDATLRNIRSLKEDLRLHKRESKEKIGALQKEVRYLIKAVEKLVLNSQKKRS